MRFNSIGLTIASAFIAGLLACVVGATNAVAQEPARLALLIGNKNYPSKVGPLKNPHNDVILVAAALKKIGFKVTVVEDADYRTMDTSIKRYVAAVRNAGKESISLFYYSGHGVANPETQINYLIPVDVPDPNDTNIWYQSFQQNDVIDKLSKQAPGATHYVIFDACRNELNLSDPSAKAIGAEKGFVPVQQTAGLLIAYATAPNKTASDGGEGGGPYARALAEELVKPGVEAVSMFRNVQLRVKQAIGQDPWLSFPSLPEVYFAGPKVPDQVEMTFWNSVKDSASPEVLGTYLQRFPNGEFAAIARALIEHHERRLKAEQAAREEERKREEEARKAAEVKRLEEERRAREQAIAEERKRAEEAKNNAELKRLEEQHRLELVARTEELRKALEEARIAREAAKAAEEQRLATLKAAEAAAKTAEDAIATKRGAEKNTDNTKVAALPKVEKLQGAGGFDGSWRIVRLSQNCGMQNYSFAVSVSGTTISGHAGGGPLRGSVTSSGALRFTHPSQPHPELLKVYSGTMHGSHGSGTFVTRGGNCDGTFTVSKY